MEKHYVAADQILENDVIRFGGSSWSVMRANLTTGRKVQLILTRVPDMEELVVQIFEYATVTVRREK